METSVKLISIFSRPNWRKMKRDYQRVWLPGKCSKTLRTSQPDGAQSYVEVLKAPVYDSKASVMGIAMFWDVTERELATSAQLQEAAESANRAKSEFPPT